MRAAASLGPWSPRSQTGVSVAAVLPNVSFCIRTNLKWSDGVGHFGSRLFWKGGSPPFLSPDLNGFSTAIATAWQNNLAQDVQNLFSLVEVDSLDISTKDGYSGIWQGGHPGTDGSLQLASSLAVNIQSVIVHHYRGGHPVLHHPPGNQTRLQGNRAWNSTYAAGVGSHFGSFIANLEAFSAGTVTGMSHVILLGYRAGATSAQVTPYPPVQYRASTSVGTMRRRLHTEA